jgi:hypothetical protein
MQQEQQQNKVESPLISDEEHVTTRRQQKVIQKVAIAGLPTPPTNTKPFIPDSQT